MSAQPQWSPLDDETADLLSLVADGPMSGHADHEWGEFVIALKRCARAHGQIHPNALRPLVRGVVKPQRVGAFTHRAASLGLITASGWAISTDTIGRNSGKPARIYRWTGGDL